jgi:hypothetical protein
MIDVAASAGDLDGLHAGSVERRIATDFARDKIAKALYEVLLDGLEFGPRDLPTPADREWIRGAIAMPIQEAAGVALHVLGWRLTQALERAPDEWMDRFESSHRGDELGWE